MPTPFARQTEQAMLDLLHAQPDVYHDLVATISQHGDYATREYRLTHQQRRNTRRMMKEDSR